MMHDKEQLYMILPFSPKTEIGWNSKDEFQSWAFYNTFIRFQRDEKGKVLACICILLKTILWNGRKYESEPE